LAYAEGSIKRLPPTRGEVCLLFEKNQLGVGEGEKESRHKDRDRHRVVFIPILTHRERLQQFREGNGTDAAEGADE